MKQTLILATLVLLTAGFAWAEEPAAAPAEAVLLGASPHLADDPLFDGGSCELPDLAGLSQEEIAAAAFAAGLETSPSAAAAVPACPVTFHCNSIANCAAGPVCALSDIGPCCDAGGGLTLCCLSGTIKVRRCPCQCTAAACSLQCVSSTDVRWRCS